jgi:hypothetical protein
MHDKIYKNALYKEEKRGKKSLSKDIIFFLATLVINVMLRERERKKLVK